MSKIGKIGNYATCRDDDSGATVVVCFDRRHRFGYRFGTDSPAGIKPCHRKRWFVGLCGVSPKDRKRVNGMMMFFAQELLRRKVRGGLLP